MNLDAAASYRTACHAFLDKKQFDPKAGASVVREASRSINTSLKLYEGEGATETKGYASSMTALASCMRASGDLDAAMEKATEAQALFRKMDYPLGVAYTMQVMAQVHHGNDDTIEAVNSAKEAQGIYLEHDDERGADFCAYLIDLFQTAPEEEGGEVVPKEKKSKGPSVSGLGDLIPGGADKVKPIAAYEAYEGRAATAPGQRRAANGAAAAGAAAVIKEEAIFSVRWVAMKNVSASAEKVVDKAAAGKVIKKSMQSCGVGAPGVLVPPASATRRRLCPSS